MSLPKVLVISLGKDEFFDAVYAHMFTALRARSDLVEATSAESAVKYFREHSTESMHIAAVIVMHPAVLKGEFDNVSSSIKQYAINGGTMIFGALCSDFAMESPKLFGSVFNLTFALLWTFGPAPIQETFVLSPKVTDDRFRHPLMPKTYNMNAMYVSSPDLKKHELVYVDSTVDLTSPPTSPHPINVLEPGPTTSDGESKRVYAGPVVFGTYGQGHVGWIGDLGVMSTEVLIAMCDLNER